MITADVEGGVVDDDGGTNREKRQQKSEHDSAGGARPIVAAREQQDRRDHRDENAGGAKWHVGHLRGSRPVNPGLRQKRARQEIAIHNEAVREIGNCCGECRDGRYETWGESRYDGLQVGFTGRQIMSRINIGGSYTLSWTKGHTNANRFESVNNPFNLDGEYSYLTTDQPGLAGRQAL